MFERMLRLIVKEMQLIIGSTRGRVMLTFPLLLQTILFPFAATLEVKHATLAIYNQDDGAAAQEIVKRLSATAAFTQIVQVHSDTQLRQVIDNQQALLAVRFDNDFSRKLQQQRSAPVQIIFDGRRSNSGQIAAGYAQQVIADYAIPAGTRPQTELAVRSIYNPNLDFTWHVLPSLVAIITTIGCLVVTALSVAREREEGTFDQLLVSPLTPAYIMAGKAVPGLLVALGQGSVIVLVAIFGFGVPFNGSVLVLLAGTLAYGAALAGIGLFISSLCDTQQQAFLGVFSFMVPAVLLSGYVAPIENMPLFLQWVAQANPLSYFIRILKGVFLKEAGFTFAWPMLWPMLLISSLTLSAALAMFRRHIA